MTEENQTKKVERTFWQKVGGRKNFNGWLAGLLLTVMAFPLNAPFSLYMTGILAALGITSGLTATEDVLKERNGRQDN